jgi:hypothetical protein
MDWPDLTAALRAKAQLAVPDAGDHALIAVTPQATPEAEQKAEALRELLRGAGATCRVCVWSGGTLHRMRQTVTVSDSLRLDLSPAMLKDGMSCDSELWWADGGCFVSETLAGEPVTLQALLLVRLSRDVPRSPHLPETDGVFIAALLNGAPGVVLWWDTDRSVHALLTSVAEACGGAEPSTPLLALAFWAGVGLTARARGLVSAAEVRGETEPAWVLGDRTDWARTRGEAVH